MKTYKIECKICGKYYQSDKRRAKAIEKKLAENKNYLKEYVCKSCRSGDKRPNPEIATVSVDVPNKGHVVAQMDISPDVEQYVPKEPVNCVQRYFGKSKNKISVSDLIDKHFNSTSPMMKNVVFIGETGTGKSLSVYDWAYKRKIPYYRYVVSGGTTGEDLIGQMVIDENGKWKFHYQVLIKMMIHGGVFVFDEINAGQREIMHLLNSITDFERIAIVTQHKGEIIKANKNFLVVATMNPPREYGLNTLSPSLKSRFIPYSFDYDIKIDEKVLGKGEKNLLNFATKVRIARENGLIETPLSTRDLVMFQTVRDEISYEVAKDMLISKFHKEEQSEIRTQIEIFLEKPEFKLREKK